MKAAEDRRLKLYHALCLSLSNRLDQVAWDDFTPADWRLLAPMAKLEGVAPLLYRTLQHAAVPTLKVPAKILAYLASEYYRTAAQNMLLYQALDPILAALQTANIPVIVLKGAALAYPYYSDVALRPMIDIDLMVTGIELQRATCCLQNLGYRKAYPELVPEISRFIGHHYYLESSSVQGFAIELHWGFVASDTDIRSLDLKWFWNQVESWEIQELHINMAGIFVLNTVANLLYLSAHLIRQHDEHQARLIWYTDLYRIITHDWEKLDWDSLIHAAEI